MNLLSGFEFGTTSGYDGTPIVARSMANNQSVVYVSMNYRLNGFGFMPGSQVKADGVGNLGLQDQRQALRWVQEHVAKFGGDPTKVTMYVSLFSLSQRLIGADRFKILQLG